jgi:hypothetical protein
MNGAVSPGSLSAPSRSRPTSPSPRSRRMSLIKPTPPSQSAPPGPQVLLSPPNGGMHAELGYPLAVGVAPGGGGAWAHAVQAAAVGGRLAVSAPAAMHPLHQLQVQQVQAAAAAAAGMPMSPLSPLALMPGGDVALANSAPSGSGGSTADAYMRSRRLSM